MQKKPKEDKLKKSWNLCRCSSVSSKERPPSTLDPTCAQEGANRFPDWGKRGTGYNTKDANVRHLDYVRKDEKQFAASTAEHWKFVSRATFRPK